MDNSEAATDNPDSKKSFLAATSHFVLIFIEHVIIAVFILHNDFADKYGWGHTITFIWLPFLLWAFAAFALAVYYLYFNKARLLTQLGPEFTCCEDNPDNPDNPDNTDGCCPRHSAMTCTGLVCRNVIDDMKISIGCSKCSGEGCSRVNAGSEPRTWWQRWLCCLCWPCCCPCCLTGSKPMQEPEEEEMKDLVTNGHLPPGVINGATVVGIDTVDEVRETPKSSNGALGSRPDDSSAASRLLNGKHHDWKAGPTSEDEIPLNPLKDTNGKHLRPFKTNDTQRQHSQVSFDL